MKKFPVALQLYSVRDDLAADFEGTVKKVAELGYDGVEFAGLYGRTAEQVKALCREAGVTPVSAHVSLAELMQDPEGVIACYAEIGCRYIAIPYLTEEYRPGHEKFGELLEDCKMLGEICRKHGIQLCYHNHDFEFVKTDGEYALDVLYREVPAALLATQLDTCWVHVAGEDPAAYVRKYAGRAPTVHLKDFVMPGKKPSRLYQLIGIDDGAQTASDGSSGFEFRPLGYGAQHIEEILEAAEEAGSEWVIVEQDDPSMDKSPLVCAEMSIRYLKSVLEK